MIQPPRSFARLRLLAARARRPGQPIASGPRGKASYITDLERNARKAGARALRPDIDALMEVVRDASSLEDAQRRVVDLYGDMATPTQLADAVRKTNLLGHLSGRFTAADEV
jgi:hypothetical protein